MSENSSSRHRSAASAIREATAEQLGEYPDGEAADPNNAEGTALIAQAHALLAIEGAIREMTIALRELTEHLRPPA